MGADMGADREALLDPFPAATAVLRRVRRRHRFHSLASPFCLTSEDHAERIPSSVVNRFIETSLAAGSVVQIAALAV
jgi:hypothetical protein